MLPDLWRIADRRVRALHITHDETNGALFDVLEGIDHHLEVDRWFHADPVFIDGERATALLLRETSIAAPRIGLFAHILWELCLDGALVRREGGAIERVLGEAFASATRDAAIDRAVALHHFDRIARTESERSVFAARMIRIQTELARGTWASGYAVGSGIAERIDGVRARVGLGAMNEDDRAKLGSVADVLIDRARAVVDVILAKPRPLRAAP